MPENSSEVDMEGIDLRGSSSSTLNGIGDCGDDESRDEYTDRANDPDITGVEKQVMRGSSSAVTEDKVDVSSSHVLEETFVDPALLVKIVGGKITGKGEVGDSLGASQNSGTMAKLAQNSSPSKHTDIGRTETNASREVDVTFSGLVQLTCWEDSVVEGITGDYRVENVSLVSGVVSHPAGLLAGGGSLASNAPNNTAAKGKALSPAAYLEHAIPCASSLVPATLLFEREMPLIDACIRGLTTAEIWGTECEDVGLHCISNKIDADQASLNRGEAEIKKSDSSGVRDVAAAPESDQETDSCVRIARGMLFDEPPHQGVSSAEASISFSLIEKKDTLTTRLDREGKDQDAHASFVHEASTVTSVDVIASTEASAVPRQAAPIPSSSVRATEGSLVAGMEEELVDEEQLVVGEAGVSPLPVDEDGKGGGKVDESSGSMVEVLPVRCDREVNIVGRLAAVEVGIESMSRPAEVEVTVNPVQELTGSNIAGSEADIRVDTSASECTVEDEKLLMKIAEPKASVRDEEANVLVMVEPSMEEAPSREEEREDIVMKHVLKEESCRVEDAVVGTSQVAEGPSRLVQEKEPEVAIGSVDVGITLVRTVKSVMKERELDIVKNLVRNLSGGVSTNQEVLSSERNTATNEGPDSVVADDSNSASSSCGSAAQKLEVPVADDGCIGCEQESKKWKTLILHGLKLLKSVATDIELKQKTTVTCVNGGVELGASGELMENGEDEGLPETMEAQTCTKSEVGPHYSLEVPKADSLVATTEVKVRSSVPGLTVSHNDGAQSFRTDTSSGVKPSAVAGWSQEVKVLETPIFSPESPDKMQGLEGFRAGSLTNLATDQPEVAGTIAMDLGRPVCSSPVQGGFEGGPERSECKDSDASPALANGKVETSVGPETTGRITELHVPGTDEDVNGSGHNVERCSDGSQHLVVGGPKVTREAVKAAPGEQIDYPSLDPQVETCSLDTRGPVIRLDTSGKQTGAASRQGSQRAFDRSHTFVESKLEEISHEGERVPFGLQSMIRVEKVLAVSTHDSLPVAKRTLPVVANKEAASTKYVMEPTLFTSYASEDRKGPPRIKRASGDHQEVGRASENELGQEKQNPVGLSARGVFSPASYKEAQEHLAGGGLEDWEGPGGMRATDAPITRDVAQITDVDFSSQDAKDARIAHELNSTIPVEAAEDPEQLMSNEEGSVKNNIRAAVEAVGSHPAVNVKKKLQTKRKKFVGETDKKPTKAACADPVPPRVEASTIQDGNAVALEDVGIHGSEELVRGMDDIGVFPTQPEISDADQAVVLWSPEGNCVVEGSPTECNNGDQTQALALRCGCGKLAVLKTVGYKSQNRGLRYYSCEKFKPTFFTRKRNRKRDNDNLTSCRFFQWLDSPRVTMEDKKEIRLQKRRQLEQILAAKAVTTNYSTRSSSKQELLQYESQRNQTLLQGVPAVYGLPVEEPKHENSDEPQPSSKKQKLNKMDPSLSTADSVAFSTRASVARKRKGPCVAVTKDRNTPGSSSCGEESSHEVSVGDWNSTIPRELVKRVKSEADKDDTPVHTYSRRGDSSRPPRRSVYMRGAKSIGKMERATADTHHVRKLLPVALAYEKSREVVLEESSEEEVSGDEKEESNEEENSLQVRCSQEEGMETPSSTSAEREQTPVKTRGQRASSTAGSGQNGRHTQARGKRGASSCSLQEVGRDPSGSESSLFGDLHKCANQSPRWIDVPLTCPFENKESGKSGVSGQQAVQHGVGRYGPFPGSHNLVVNFPTASHSGERRTISSNTVLLVKEKAREVSLAVNFKRGRSPATETGSQRVAWSKPADRMKKRPERVDVSDFDDEETGPSGSRGLRSLKDMLKRENSDGTLADYEVANESQPPYCECKKVKRRAALKTVLSNSANHGLRYWVCVNHRPLFQKKSLWEGDPNDESCKFFRWLDTPIISYAERKKKLAARRRRNERRRR